MRWSRDLQCRWNWIGHGVELAPRVECMVQLAGLQVCVCEREKKRERGPVLAELKRCSKRTNAKRGDVCLAHIALMRKSQGLHYILER